MSVRQHAARQSASSPLSRWPDGDHKGVVSVAFMSVINPSPLGAVRKSEGALWNPLPDVDPSVEDRRTVQDGIHQSYPQVLTRCGRRLVLLIHPAKIAYCQGSCGMRAPQMSLARGRPAAWQDQ